MKYKKCPICELNWIEESAEMCDVCAKQTHPGGNASNGDGRIFTKPEAQICYIFTLKKTIYPNKHCNSTIYGYTIADKDKKLLGVIWEDNSEGDHRAVIRYINEHEDRYGTWHKISSHGKKISTYYIEEALYNAMKEDKAYIELWVDER